MKGCWKWFSIDTLFHLNHFLLIQNQAEPNKARYSRSVDQNIEKWKIE